MRIGPPCAIIAEMPPMAISASDRSQRSQCTGVDNLARFLQCGMKAMVESDLYAAPVRSCSGNYWFQFVRSASRGLLHQHMLSRFHGRQSNRSEERRVGKERRSRSAQRLAGKENRPDNSTQD